MADDITLVNLDEGTDDPRQARAQLAESVRRLNAAWTIIFGNGMSDQSAELIAANAAGKPLLIVGAMHVGSVVTLTVPLVDSMNRLFTNTSLITIDNDLPVRPEWFGLSTAGAGDRAVAALPSDGGVVLFENRTYVKPFVHAYNAGYLSKRGVILHGVKMPRPDTDLKQLVDGTILQGTLLVYADGVEIRNLGVDCGKTYCDASNGGSPLDALVLTYPSDALKDAAALRIGAKLENVVGLAYGPDSLVHAVIAAEGYANVSCTGTITGIYGVHGVVIKATSVSVERLMAYCNGQDGVILKTDAQATAAATDVQIGSALVNANGPAGSSPYAVATTGVGFYLHAAAGTLDRIQVGRVMSYGYPVGVGTNYGGAHNISDVSIDSIITDQAGVSGTTQGVQIYAPAGEIHRFRIGSISARNTTVGLQAIFNQGSNIGDHLHVDRLEVVNAQGAIDIANSAYVSIGTVIAENCSDAVYRITGTPKLSVGMLFMDTLTPAVYSSLSGGLVPTLSNGWTNFGGTNKAFGVDLTGGRVALRGLLKPGSSNVIATLPQWAWPTGIDRVGFAQGFNGTSIAPVPVVISASTGEITINEQVGGYANATQWLSLSGITYDQQV